MKVYKMKEYNDTKKLDEVRRASILALNLIEDDLNKSLDYDEVVKVEENVANLEAFIYEHLN